jgi:16S rRNA (guanine966-N2)-methyltransferase
MPEARSRKLARATTAAPKRAAPTFADPTRVASKPAASGAAHRVRIIGGVWKRTPLPVADADGLRPTPDRVRETVFNWLSGALAGRHCLDLFAGTGALGFEAASRGAASVTMVESDVRVAALLRATVQRLSADQVTVIAGDAIQAMRRAQGDDRRFDLVFLDPPFRMGWIERVLPVLAGVLAPQALVYLESEQVLDAPAFSALLGRECELLRCNKAGQVFYHLLRCP